MAQPLPRDLSWIDEFIERVRPYVYVREVDHIIIKRPNQAQKLNEQGMRILKSLLDGMTISALLDLIGRDPQRIHDVHVFMLEIKRFMEGTLDEGTTSCAVEVVPFDLHFSQLPILSEVAITYRCNLKCTFCYAGCNCTTNPVGDDREMTIAEVQEVLRKIYHDAEVPSVSEASALQSSSTQAISEEQNWQTRVSGTTPAYFRIRNWSMTVSPFSCDATTMAKSLPANSRQKWSRKFFRTPLMLP